MDWKMLVQVCEQEMFGLQHREIYHKNAHVFLSYSVLEEPENNTTISNRSNKHKLMLNLLVKIKILMWEFWQWTALWIKEQSHLNLHINVNII